MTQAGTCEGWETPVVQPAKGRPRRVCRGACKARASDRGAQADGQYTQWAEAAQHRRADGSRTRTATG
jgi:hypothetical protein